MLQPSGTSRPPAAHSRCGHEGSTYDLTGPRAFTLEEAARLLSRPGREVRYVDEALEEAYRSRSAYGAPDWEVEGWVTSYVAIARGELDVVSDAVAGLAGHEPVSLETYLSPQSRRVAGRSGIRRSATAPRRARRPTRHG